MNLTEPDIEIFMNSTHVTKIGSSHEKFDVWPRSKVSWLLFRLLQLFLHFKILFFIIRPFLQPQFLAHFGQHLSPNWPCTHHLCRQELRQQGHGAVTYAELSLSKCFAKEL